MNRTAIIQGGLGDIVYSIPICRLLKITRMYVKENFYSDGSSQYTAIKPLLESQGIECLPTSGQYPIWEFDPATPYDIKLDDWRMRGGRDRVHIIKNMMLHYKCFKPDWNKPFLYDIPNYDTAKNLIFYTWRWREGSPVRWKEVLHKFNLTYDNSFFIGLAEDYELFKQETNSDILHLHMPDLLEMAGAIKGCDRLFCNQGVALTLAQGLGKNYWLEKKPNKTNTLFFTPNEHLL